MDDPFNRLDLEFGLYTLVGASKALSALLGCAPSIDVNPAQLGALVDLIAEQALTCQRLAGFHCGFETPS